MAAKPLREVLVELLGDEDAARVLVHKGKVLAYYRPPAHQGEVERTFAAADALCCKAEDSLLPALVLGSRELWGVPYSDPPDSPPMRVPGDMLRPGSMVILWDESGISCIPEKASFRACIVTGGPRKSPAVPMTKPKGRPTGSGDPNLSRAVHYALSLVGACGGNKNEAASRAAKKFPAYSREQIRGRMNEGKIPQKPE